MSINRVGHMIAHKPLRESHQKAARLLEQVIEGSASHVINEFRRRYPGEQCYLLVLDTREWVVQEMLRSAMPDMVETLKQAEARASADAGGKRPDVALWVHVVPRAAGVEVARFLAKDEPLIQVQCDEAQAEDVMAICLAYGGMVMTALECPAPGADLGAAERERRAARSRRAGR